MTTTTTTGRAPIENGELAYEVGGEGPPVVLAHAGVTDSRIWDHAFADLSADHRMVRFDARGHGQSSTIAGDFSPGDDLVALLDHLAVDRAVVVGCSLGGLTAIDLALDHPNRVAGLVVTGSAPSGYALTGDAASWQCRLARAAEEALAVLGRGEDPSAAVEALVEVVVVGLLDGPHRTPDQLDGAVRARTAEIVAHTLVTHYANAGELRPTGAAERLGELGVPVLVVTGSLDFGDLRHAADLIASRVPNARQVVLEGIGHLPMLEAPDVFVAAVRRFLAGIGRG